MDQINKFAPPTDKFQLSTYICFNEKKSIY